MYTPQYMILSDAAAGFDTAQCMKRTPVRMNEPMIKGGEHSSCCCVADFMLWLEARQHLAHCSNLPFNITSSVSQTQALRALRSSRCGGPCESPCHGSSKSCMKANLALQITSPILDGRSCIVMAKFALAANHSKSPEMAVSCALKRPTGNCRGFCY